jgi:hypothetical protein
MSYLIKSPRLGPHRWRGEKREERDGYDRPGEVEWIFLLRRIAVKRK